MQMRLCRTALLGLAVISVLSFARLAHAQSIETVLYSFCSQGGSSCTDGDVPAAGLVRGTDGNFYGTASSGGAYETPYGGGGGTAFKITPAGVFTTLYNFCSLADCNDGAFPQTALVQGTDGNFYGTTGQGGVYNMYGGTIFKMTPAGALITLYSFCSDGDYPDCADGAAPSALVQGTDGNFYGTTTNGGANKANGYGGGTAFRITPAGEFTTIYNFCSQTNCTDGAYPGASMVVGADGNLYGTAESGGANGGGTLFQLTYGGTLTTVYSFCSQGGSSCTDGDDPGGLVLGTDKNFYGTAGGGANTYGTIFKITPAGTLTTLYSFCSQGAYPDCTDGQNPVGLMQATNGNFYGTTVEGGANSVTAMGGYGGGTVFQVTPTGTLTTLYNFCALGEYCTDGYLPNGELAQDTAGNFYGTTYSGGANFDNVSGSVGGGGTVFKLVLATKENSTLTFKATPNPAPAGQTIALTATVTGSTNGTPTGYVSFTYNGASLGNVQLNSSGVATEPVSTLGSATGTYAATATYLGSSAYNGSSTSAISVTVNKAPSAATMTTTPNPAQASQAITLSAIVSGADESPTGTVTFSVGGTALGSARLEPDSSGPGFNSSFAELYDVATSSLAPGTYPVVATYSGDAYYNGSHSAAYDVVLQKAVTSTTLSGGPTTVTPPASVTLVAAVRRSASATSGVPTGTVTFYYQTMSLGTVGLNQSGEASITASTKGLAAGTYPITVKYSGDASDLTSTSAALDITVK